VQIRPGEHTLHIKSGDLAFDTKLFTLGSGMNPALKVELLPGELRVVQSGEVLGTIPRAEPAAAAAAMSAVPQPVPLAPTAAAKAVSPVGLAERMSQMPPPELDGDWRLQDGSLIVPVDGPTRPFRLYFGDPAWTDVDVRASVTLHERWVVEFGVIGRQQGKARWEFIVAGFAAPGNRDLLPFTEQQDAWHSPKRVFKSNQTRVIPGTTHTVELRLRGDRCTALLDGEEVATSESAGLPRGRVGISTFGNTRFHNLEVRSPAGELLWSGLPPLE
jgi:hypothetical protein